MNTNQDTVFPRKLFLENLVFVDGFGRSGKFMASPIVASLERVEHIQLSWLLEYVPVMYQMEHISKDAAVSLLQTEVENGLYYTLIGRNANFRFSDITGIWNAKDPKLYLERIHSDEGDAVLEVLKTSPPILLYLTHDILCHGDIFFEAFESLKIIHIERHPVDVVASWYRKRTAQMVDNLRNQTLLIKGSEQNVPWYAAGWEEKYENLSQIDRLIHSFKVLNTMRKTYMTSIADKQKEQICMVRFEELISKPKPVIDKICRFLGTEPSLHTSNVLVKERCPRIVDENERIDKLKRIKANASRDAIDILMRICEEYESNKVIS